MIILDKIFARKNGLFYSGIYEDKLKEKYLKDHLLLLFELFAFL